MLRVRNGTKQGYDEAHVGDGISLAYPESDTRRGRVPLEKPSILKRFEMLTSVQGKMLQKRISSGNFD